MFCLRAQFLLFLMWQIMHRVILHQETQQPSPVHWYNCLQHQAKAQPSKITRYLRRLSHILSLVDVCKVLHHTALGFFSRNSRMPTNKAQLFVAAWCAGWLVNVAKNWTFYQKLYETVNKFAVLSHVSVYICIQNYHW